MPSLEPLWHTLEREEVLAAVDAQWRLWLGETLEAVRPFLKPWQELATNYPCERHPELCARRVIHHGPDDIVAVCGREPPECERIELLRSAVVVYQLDLPRLLGQLAKLLDYTGTSERIRGARAWQLGAKSHDFDQTLFLLLPDREDGYGAAISHVLSRFPTEGMTVLVPDAANLLPGEVALLRQKSIEVLSCSVLFQADRGEIGLAPTSNGGATPSRKTKADNATVDPLAIQLSSDNAGFVEIHDTAELERRRSIESTVDHFVDGTVDRPTCSKQNGETRDSGVLTQGEMAMLLAYIIRFVDGLDYERPERLQIPNLSTEESKKKAFNFMRRKVDRNTSSRQKYALFKSRRSMEGGSQLYALSPDAGTSYCFLLRPEDIATIRNQTRR